MNNPINILTPKILFQILITLSLVLSCSKDDNESYSNVTNTMLFDTTITKEVKLNAEISKEVTSNFSPLQDAYIQSGKGYNQKIVRLEDGRRKTYLMFDLSKIQSGDDSLLSVSLEFTISSDGGDGTISVFKGKTGNWSELKLSANSAPAEETLLGTKTDSYKIGQTKRIKLDSDLLKSEIVTLVMTHENGNDLAFASKEHPDEKGPKLIVTYNSSTAPGLTKTKEAIIQSESSNENKPIAAVISGSIPTSGKAPLLINFKAWNSKNQQDITGYFWDFKDGATSTTKNPEHTFTSAGRYAVTLTVKNAAGYTDSTSRTIIVGGADDTNGGSENFNSTNENSVDGENIGITAVISGSIPSSAQAPSQIAFKAWNSKNQDKIKGYFWNFGDGSTSTIKNASHTFTDPGNYNVKLTVKNASGQTHSTTRAIQITGSSTSNNSSTDNDNRSDTDNSNEGNSGGGNNNQEINNSGGNSSNYPSNAVFASDYGYNSSDATSAFRAALKSGSSYVVIDKQSGDWVIQPSRFFDLSNMTIVFEPGVTLRAKPGAFVSTGARLFQLTRASNVTIEGGGATFRMNKSEYGSGEQRHALDINVSSNVTVRGLTIRDSGGDGVHIAGNGKNNYSQNIILENIKSYNNVRNGLSIISAQDVWVRDSEFSNSSGKSPESGVTLETDTASERLVNINFSGCKFSGNHTSGFLLSTTKMNSGSTPISIKVVDSEFSENMVSPNGVRGEIFIGGGQTANPVGGEIRFERIQFNGSRDRIIFTRKSSKGFRAVFKDCEATNVVSSINSSPIRLESHVSRNSVGGIRFENFDIQYNRNVPFMHINAPNTSGFQVKDISGSFNITEPNDNSLKYSGGYKATSNSNVSINYKHN